MQILEALAAACGAFLSGLAGQWLGRKVLTHIKEGQEAPLPTEHTAPILRKAFANTKGQKLKPKAMTDEMAFQLEQEQRR